MEAATDTVTAVFTNDRETFTFRVFLNCSAQRAQANARFHHPQRQIQAFLRDAAQTLAQNSRFADDKHFRGVAVVLVFNHSHIDVDDIAVFQKFGVVRDPVAHHFINRDTYGLRIAVVTQAGGNGLLLIHDIVITDTIQLAGADARFNKRFDHFQYISGQAASDAHFFDFFRGLD
ncbi:hypothetical protein SDC9_121657 [bioreactor metagenome]|uniref:Uncharacterized protein n=1 Tax=bioreactor metagenome TaxID=1076179 RepID=A0A645CCP6_9ZZZZ